MNISARSHTPRSVIHAEIALLRVNQISGSTIDFKSNIIKSGTIHYSKERSLSITKKTYICILENVSSYVLAL
jgi:hypothetical protein